MILGKAEEINPAIQSLPIARELDVYVGDSEEPTRNFKAIVVNGQIVSIPTKRYKLVQHEEAFRPVINGLSVSGKSDFKWRMWSTNKKAHLDLIVGSTTDSVEYGFRVFNSFDGTTAIRYSFQADFVSKRWIEVVGFRKTCSNGMIIRVPLAEAEFVKEVERKEVERLLSETGRILHTSNAEAKLEAVQYITEAILLLEKPIVRMIETAQKTELTNKDIISDMIKKYVGKRMKDRIVEQFGKEEQTLWGLYNSITWLATHGDIKDSTKQSLLNKSANMLTLELTQ